jgi:hypothetical protein
MLADGSGQLSLERLYRLGRFVKARLREKRVMQDYGNVYLDLREATVKAALRYLSEYFDYSDDVIYQKQAAPEKLIKVYELDPVVADIFKEFLEQDYAAESTVLYRPVTC